MLNIAVLPTPRGRAAAAATNPRNAGTCGIYDIAGRLGQAHRPPAYICRTLNALIAQQGFPRPFPLLQGGHLAAKVLGASKWAQPAVDAWFDNQLPPEARGVIDLAERAAVDSRLAVNAALLFADNAA